ncbi:MAG: ROK family protein, partial [Clostridia bacterium]|nr:ROK family protein [Clostridia bacterium]
LCDGKIENAGGRTAFDAMRLGDECAAKVCDDYIRYIAVGTVNLVNIFQPDVICVSGGVGNEGENLLVPLRKVVSSEIYSIHAKKQTQILAAELGNDAGIIGAALLDE